MPTTGHGRASLSRNGVYMTDKVTTYTLVLNQSQLEIIDKGLQEMPFKWANPILADLNRQIQKQDATRFLLERKREQKGESEET